MRNTDIFGNVTSISMCTLEGVKKYKSHIHVSIDRYIHEENGYHLTNMINIKWVRHFKFVRLST